MEHVPIVFTVDEVAKMLCVSSRTVTRYCEDGLITFRQARTNGRLMFTADDINEFLELTKKGQKND